MKQSSGERIFYSVNYVVMGLIGFICILPLIYLLAVSLSSEQAVVSGKVGLWPVGFNWDNYRLVIEGSNIGKAFWNSIVITVFGTCLNMGFTILAAYPLAKKAFKGRRFYTMLILFTMLFNAGLIPNYLLVKNLGLVNTYWALWLPSLISVYNMLVLKTFFETLPDEIEEAARIDGASEARLLLQIILPLSMPVLAALTLFYAVGHWNSFLNVMLYINSSDKKNMAVMVQEMVVNSFSRQMDQLQPDQVQMVTPEAIRASSIFIMIVPMLILYPFLQKYFVKGIMVGSIKG